QVMFEWESGSGNNVYLDDINFKSNNPSSIQQLVDFKNFTVFPNPAKDKVHVSIDATISSKAQVSLTDLSGRVVKSFDTNLIPGSNELSLQVTDLANGVYLIQVNTEKGKMAKRIIIE
ncbi:MAG: hypothetical protein ACJAY8_001246, partial [Sphingobacteriales bacterium]